MATATAPAEETTPWLTVQKAADRADVSTRLIYENIQRGRLRAARLGSRHQIRIHETWLDAWIDSLAPTIINPDAPGDDQPVAFSAFTPRSRKTQV